MLNQAKYQDPNKDLFTGDSELDDILVDAYRSTKFFAKVFFPDIFFAPFSNLHEQIFDLIDSDAKKIAISAPRGLGKTSIARIVGCKSILYKDKRYINYISNSSTNSEIQTENIKMSLRMSTEVKDIFGDIKDDSSGVDFDTFSKKSWIADGYTFVVPRGAGQQIRGQNWLYFRPDLFIIDDLEDPENLDNENQRKKLWNWFISDVELAKPTFGDSWKYLYIDTIKHEDSVLEKLMISDDWESLRLSICTENYKTLAPDFMSQEDLDKEVARARKEHTLDAFARERMSMPISKETSSFKPDYFKYYQETDDSFIKQKHNLTGVVIIDPAKTTNMANAQSAIAAVSVNIETQGIYIREARGEYYHPEQLYADAFATAIRYGIRTIAVEVTGLEEFIKHPLTNEMHRLGYNFELVWLKARRGQGEFAGLHGGKKARIASLIPYYRSGLVYHNSTGCGTLETQLLGFPKSKLWDVMDATSYIVELMEMSLVYFYPNRNEVESEKDIENEYKELEELYKQDMKNISLLDFEDYPGIYNQKYPEFNVGY